MRARAQIKAAKAKTARRTGKRGKTRRSAGHGVASWERREKVGPKRREVMRRSNAVSTCEKGARKPGRREVCRYRIVTAGR